MHYFEVSSTKVELYWPTAIALTLISPITLLTLATLKLFLLVISAINRAEVVLMARQFQSMKVTCSNLTAV
jgi:hypothetical protein